MRTLRTMTIVRRAEFWRRVWARRTKILGMSTDGAQHRGALAGKSAARESREAAHIARAPYSVFTLRLALGLGMLNLAMSAHAALDFWDNNLGGNSVGTFAGSATVTISGTESLLAIAPAGSLIIGRGGGGSAQISVLQGGRLLVGPNGTTTLNSTGIIAIDGATPFSRRSSTTEASSISLPGRSNTSAI